AARPGGARGARRPAHRGGALAFARRRRRRGRDALPLRPGGARRPRAPRGGRAAAAAARPRPGRRDLRRRELPAPRPGVALALSAAGLDPGRLTLLAGALS